MRAPRVGVPPRERLLAATLLGTLVACGPAPPASLVPGPSSPTSRESERISQQRIDAARAFLEQGRPEAAERSARRALEAALARPEDHGSEDHASEAHRILARALEAQGREEEARQHRRRAAALDPPPPPPPRTPLPVDSRGVVVVLGVLGAGEASGPDPVPAPGARRPSPEDAEGILREHLSRRLPRARVVRMDPPSVASARDRLIALGARTVLSLGVERGFCAWSRKDGPFAVASLRVAAATAAELEVPPTTVRRVLEPPPPEGDCVREALVRALEAALARPEIRRALEAPSGDGTWPSPILRALLPELGARVALRVEEGRRALATGRVAAAAQAFHAALAVDPEDPGARAYLREAEETLRMARALEGAGAARSGSEALPFSLPSGARETAEALLAEERRRRDELLAAVHVTGDPEASLTREVRAALRPIALPQPPTPGAAFARERAAEPVEARALYGPRGRRISVFYVRADGGVPILRESDGDGDGQPDTWVAYRDGRVSDRWEARKGRGWPDLHLTLDPEGEISRIAIDADADRHPERVFDYAEGALVAEARDTDGDSVLDRFDTFDAGGRLRTRDEDVDADGRVDVRSHFRDGRLVRREIEDPAMAERLGRR